MANPEPPPLITECPNCHTRFRVGESQLQIAHGRVRCGACLAVFAGVDHLLLDDAEAAPQLPSETNMLESVLAELAEEVADDGVNEVAKENAATELGGATDHGSTAARAYELDALAARRGDTEEIELSGGYLAAEIEESQETAELELESAQDVDWTSVSVDTQEFGPRITLELASSGASSRFADASSGEAPSVAPPESQRERQTETEAVQARPRATIEDALNDEDALRWWLEDELPNEDNGFATGDDDSMVVQLSELDAVRDDDDLDLEKLLGTQENSSKAQLEELFRELREESPDSENNQEPNLGTESDDAAENDLPAETDAAELTSSDALRQVVSDLKAEAETAEDDSPEPAPSLEDSERSAAELQDAIDQAEPLVTRAMANGALTASANKVAAAERAAEAELAAERAQLQGKVRTSTEEEAAEENATGDFVAAKANPLPAAGTGVELVEPPADRKAVQAESWNSSTFPETPAESVVNITAEMAAAGRADPVESQAKVAAGNALDTARSTLEQWLHNPYALRVGTVIASLLLVGQVMFWQFDDWAKSPALRPVYAGICGVVGCELPLRRSVQDMQSRKLAVRSHPDKADKLLVDALIINEAEFAQPFPVIELQFMDLNQQVVRSYRLEPDAYLDGELAGSDALMAIRTPVHIDIEIDDPGPSAVNYQLQFR